jgi:hypothetical protein
VGELRMREPWASRPDINPPLPPFGITLQEADAIALAVAPAVLLEYADAVHSEIGLWLDSLSDADLDERPDIGAHALRYPSERITGEYLAELSDMADWNIARCLASPCIGHVRGHFGEIDLLLALMK